MSGGSLLAYIDSDGNICGWRTSPEHSDKHCDDRSWPAFHVAAMNGMTKILEMIVKTTGNHDIDDESYNYPTPMCLAAQENEVDAIETLYRLGSNALDTPVKYYKMDEYEERLRVRGWTPLHFAAAHESLDALKTLVRLGSTSLEASDKEGRTPLMAAFEAGKTEAVQILLSLGASIDDLEESEIEILPSIDETMVLEVRFTTYFSQSLMKRLLCELARGTNHRKPSKRI